MPYERTHQIEQRFQRAIYIIMQNSHNARELAAALGVSQPTVQDWSSLIQIMGWR